MPTIQATPPTKKPAGAGSRWARLEQDSHLLDVQDMIRAAIRRGLIRVVPGEGGRVRILLAERPAPPGGS